MTDIEKAIINLTGHSICLCLGDDMITDDGRGISPMMRFIAEGRALSGYSAADIIIGKAAAMLFAKAGIISVYGRTMSKKAVDFLEMHDIEYSYGELTENIINRTGDGMCPMEMTVSQINDVDEAYEALKRKIAMLKAASESGGEIK